jgi:hypothetical protein
MDEATNSSESFTAIGHLHGRLTNHSVFVDYFLLVVGMYSLHSD